jgi:hypothetical protein
VQKIFRKPIPPKVYTKSVYLYVMKMLSLKLDDEIFLDTEKITKKMKSTRNRYINDAIRLYNKFNERNLLKKQLAFESKLTRNSSLEILEEFEEMIKEIDEKI